MYEVTSNSAECVVLDNQLHGSLIKPHVHRPLAEKWTRRPNLFPFVSIQAGLSRSKYGRSRSRHRFVFVAVKCNPHVCRGSIEVGDDSVDKLFDVNDGVVGAFSSVCLLSARVDEIGVGRATYTWPSGEEHLPSGQPCQSSEGPLGEASRTSPGISPRSSAQGLSWRGTGTARPMLTQKP